MRGLAPMTSSPQLFYSSYYTFLGGSYVYDLIFFYTDYWNGGIIHHPIVHIIMWGTYSQCYGRSNEIINFTLNELNWPF